MTTQDEARAGRAMVNLSQDELAERVNVAKLTARNFEASPSMPAASNPQAMRNVVDSADAIFLADGEGTGRGPGVRLKAV